MASALERELRLTITYGDRVSAGLAKTNKTIEDTGRITQKTLGPFRQFMEGMQGLTRTLRFVGGTAGRALWALDSMFRIFSTKTPLIMKMTAAFGGLVSVSWQLIRLAGEMTSAYFGFWGRIVGMASRAAGQVVRVVGGIFRQIVDAAENALRGAANTFRDWAREGISVFTELEAGARAAWTNIAEQGESAFRTTFKAIRDIVWDTGQSIQDTKRAMRDLMGSFHDTGQAATVARAAIKGAVALATDLFPVQAMLQTTTKAWGLTAENAEETMAKLTVAVAEGRVEAEQFARNFQLIAPIASAAGASLNDVLGVVAAGSLVFGTSSRQFSGLRSELEQLTELRKEGIGPLQAGLTQFDAKGNLELRKTLELLRTKTAGMNAQQRNMTLQQFFPDVRGMTHIAALLGVMEDDWQRIFKHTSDSAHAAKVLNAAYEGAMNSLERMGMILEARFGLLKETTFGKIGAAILRPIGRLAMKISDEIDAAFQKAFTDEWATQLSNSVDRLIQKFASLKVATDAQGRSITLGAWATTKLNEAMDWLSKNIPEWTKALGDVAWQDVFDRVAVSAGKWRDALYGVGKALADIVTSIGKMAGINMPEFPGGLLPRDRADPADVLAGIPGSASMGGAQSKTFFGAFMDTMDKVAAGVSAIAKEMPAKFDAMVKYLGDIWATLKELGQSFLRVNEAIMPAMGEVAANLLEGIGAIFGRFEAVAEPAAIIRRITGTAGSIMGTMADKGLKAGIERMPELTAAARPRPPSQMSEPGRLDQILGVVGGPGGPEGFFDSVYAVTGTVIMHGIEVLSGALQDIGDAVIGRTLIWGEKKRNEVIRKMVIPSIAEPFIKVLPGAHMGSEYVPSRTKQGVPIRPTSRPAGFQHGGVVKGPPGVDKVPAMLTAGEVVIPKEVAPLFHGTPDPLSALKETYATEGQIRNLYGPGFYTTDNPTVAAGYALRRGRNVASHGKVYDVQWIGSRRPKFLNLDAPIPSKLYGPVEKYISESFGLERFGLLRKVPFNLEFARYVSEMSYAGYTNDDALESLYGLEEVLKKHGYKGFEHVGGEITGGVKHNVKIFFDPVEPSYDKGGKRFGGQSNLAITPSRAGMRALRELRAGAFWEQRSMGTDLLRSPLDDRQGWIHKPSKLEVMMERMAEFEKAAPSLSGPITKGPSLLSRISGPAMKALGAMGDALMLYDIGRLNYSIGQMGLARMQRATGEASQANFMRERRPRGLAAGGVVTGPGGKDSVPAMLTPGEMVIPKGATKTWLELKQEENARLRGEVKAITEPFGKRNEAYKAAQAAGAARIQESYASIQRHIRWQRAGWISSRDRPLSLPEPAERAPYQWPVSKSTLKAARQSQLALREWKSGEVPAIPSTEAMLPLFLGRRQGGPGGLGSPATVERTRKQIDYLYDPLRKGATSRPSGDIMAPLDRMSAATKELAGNTGDVAATLREILANIESANGNLRGLKQERDRLRGAEMTDGVPVR